jgi:hypothetical protein
VPASSASGFDPETTRLNQLRAIYASLVRQYRARHTGGPSNYGNAGDEFQLWGGLKDGTRYESPMIAFNRFLEERQLDPEVYMNLVFKKWPGNRAPMVNKLMSQTSLRLYQQSEQRLPDLVAHQLRTFNLEYVRETQLAQLRGKAPEEAALSVILDLKFGFSVLYRYCTLMQGGYTRLAGQRFETTALFEYSPIRKHYDRIWGDFIPQELKVLAAERAKRQGVR